MLSLQGFVMCPPASVKHLSVVDMWAPKVILLLAPASITETLSLTNNLCNRLCFSLKQPLVGNSPFNSMWYYWKNTGILSGVAVSVICPLLRPKPTHVEGRSSIACKWHLIICPVHLSVFSCVCSIQIKWPLIEISDSYLVGMIKLAANFIPLVKQIYQTFTPSFADLTISATLAFFCLCLVWGLFWLVGLVLVCFFFLFKWSKMFW